MHARKNERVSESLRLAKPVRVVDVAFCQCKSFGRSPCWVPSRGRATICYSGPRSWRAGRLALSSVLSFRGRARYPYLCLPAEVVCQRFTLFAQPTRPERPPAQKAAYLGSSCNRGTHNAIASVPRAHATVVDVEEIARQARGLQLLCREPGKQREKRERPSPIHWGAIKLGSRANSCGPPAR